jgi:hypothetical protein
MDMRRRDVSPTIWWSTPEGTPTERLVRNTLEVIPDVTFSEMWELVGGGAVTLETAVRRLLATGKIVRWQTDDRRPLYCYRVAGGAR